MCSLPKTVVLLHGAVGCGSCANGNNLNVRAGNAQRGRSSGDVVWLSTALGELNVVGGGEAKLGEALLEADRAFKPEVILAVSGCLPGVIGDDLDAIVARVQPQTKARLMAVHCEGFKSRFMATAYDVVYHALGRHLMPEPSKKIEKLPDTVNVMNVGSMGLVDENELSRLLAGIGLKTNFFPVFSDPLSFHQAAAAILSVSVCPTHDDYFLTRLEEQFGVPYIIHHMPIGIENTRLWLTDVAERTGRQKEAKKLIIKEEKELNLALKEFKPLLAGKTAFIAAGEYRSLATSSLLRELGFIIKGIRSFHFDQYAEVELEKLTRANQEFIYNVANVQPFEEANLLKRNPPDIFLGHWHGNSTAARLGIPTQVIYNSGYAYLGYQGVYDLARRLHRRLSHSSFYRRLGRYASLPYRSQWYQENPFSHIRNRGVQ
jgi:nitrogenase molybdenum-iron protein alpha chain